MGAISLNGYSCPQNPRKGIILQKTSSENEIRKYFEAVLTLSKNNEEFPIDLDEVWMLVYGSKKDALDALKENFMQNVDYQFLGKNPENSRPGRPTEKYKLTVSCMEYFIVRKVRPVFEVYRQVFHKAMEQKPISQVDLLVQSALLLQEQERRINEVENRVSELEARSVTDFQYYTILAYSVLHGIKVTKTEAISYGKTASKMCRFRNLKMDTIRYPKYGKINQYPVDILDEVFNIENR